MCKIIAIANQKGGVAKTTTTINLGVGLSKVGKRVMLIDADPQGHLTMGLGFPKNLRVTLKTMMENIIMGLEFDPREAILHHEEGIDVRVAYLNGSKAIEAPPVELIQFVDNEIHKAQSDLFTTSISEVCFYTDDIDSVYRTLIENHVECLSEPQYFDFRADGFGESRAFYFRDPDGIILEMMQPL